jgi:GNAT superfamily N-acetyltransferase
MTAAVPTIDLATRWINAWTYARSLEVGRLDGWPLVRVGSASRETELLCVEPGAEAAASLMSHVAGVPRAMLTVIADDMKSYTSLTLPPGVRLDRDDETLMTRPLSTATLPSLDPIYSARWEILGNQLKYVVEHQDRVAAEGLVAVLGVDAVYDAVETTPAYQRRGLGRHVMAALSNRAIESGATTGILAATASGRLLYGSLGWRATSAMWSIMGDAVDR